MDNKPQALTDKEIKEIAAIEEVQQSWGANTEREMAEMLEDHICAVKFPKYMTDGPGYAGPLYILMGGAIQPPMLLIREQGRIIAA
jgi:hypothetical protein